MDGTQTGTTTHGQSEPGSNGNESITSYFTEFQNLSLTTGYPKHPFWLFFLAGGLSPRQTDTAN